MKEELQKILTDVEKAIDEVHTRPSFESFKATISGPNGRLTQAMKGMRNIPKEAKPTIGKLINATKQAIETLYEKAQDRIVQGEQTAQLGPRVDPGLPAPDSTPGGLHPITQVRRQLVALFHKVGFTVAETPELETEWFCFDALNTPVEHPARDAQDTLFLNPDTSVTNVSRRGAETDREAYLLRTHTSSVQIRTLVSETPPLRIIAPGRVFRRDTTDATHSANFHQLEGLYVDRQVSLVDLKAILDYFVQEMFGSKVETRLRPSFFPFTEPSFEMDIRSPNLGKLSNRWIEIMGCGMVHPNVFKATLENADDWSGYAFGIGLERIAMICHGIDDIRLFYQNDLRFLKQFH